MTHGYGHTPCHPEHVSESVRGEWKDKARGEKLKFAVERAHSPLCSRLGKAFLTPGNAFPPRETIFWSQKMLSQIGKPFFGLRKCFPKSGNRFLASENGFPHREADRVWSFGILIVSLRKFFTNIL